MRATTSQPLLTRWGFPEGMRPLRESMLVVVVLSPLITYIYRLWGAHWRIPFNYSGDGLGASAQAKSIIENGWYLSNPRLAAPFSADWRDFPLGGANAHFLAQKILGAITGNYAIAVNLYFIFTFFAIALVAYFVVRYLGFGIATACVVGVLYAFLPYHAYRNVAQLTRAAYYPVPLAVLVIVWMNRYRDDLLRMDESRWRVRRGRLGCALAVAILIGCTDDQNVAYLASILGVLAIVLALRDRDWRPLALAAIVSITAFGSLFVNNVPFLLARVERGPNSSVANRGLTDQDYYALRPVDLILPAPGHRIAALSEIAATSTKGQVTNGESAGSSLGVIGSIGLIWSVGAALAMPLGVRFRRRTTDFVAQLGVINIVGVLIGTIGGLSFLIALAGFRTYRTWNRISLFIAFCSLIAVAIGLERFFGYVRRRVARPAIGVAIVAILVAVLVLAGALDQTAPRSVPNYKAIAAVFDGDAAFYQALEKSVPAHSMIFQLPVAAFPEAGTINKMGDYDEFTAYLQTKTLRWSYGGMRGRIEGDWQKGLDMGAPVGALAQVAAVGFVGVVINRDGFADRATSLLNALAPYTGPPRLRARDDHLLYLDLTGFRARLQSDLGAAAVTQSAHVVLGDTVVWTGFAPPETICGGAQRRWSTARSSTIQLDNLSRDPVTITASASFVANPATTHISVRAPGSSEEIALSGGAASWSRQLMLPPGKSQLRFSVDGPKIPSPGDARTLYFALLGYKLGARFDSPVLSWAAALSPPCKPLPPVRGG